MAVAKGRKGRSKGIEKKMVSFQRNAKTESNKGQFLETV